MGDELRIWCTIEPMIEALSGAERVALFALMFETYCEARGRELKAASVRCIRCADTARSNAQS